MTVVAQQPLLKRLTPVMVVDRVEPSIRFWADLGFRLATQLPADDGTLIFASAERDGIEVMYQTKASVLAEDQSQAQELAGHSIVLYIEVSDLDEVEKAVAGAPVVKARHQTFYGTTELYVKEPGGHTVGFAKMG